MVPEPMAWHPGPCVPVILLGSKGFKGCVSRLSRDRQQTSEPSPDNENP